MDLSCDGAFVVRIEADGTWEREWIGGEVPTRPGVALDDLDFDSWDSYIFEEDRQASIDHFNRAIARGKDRFEYRLELPDAGVRWVESALRFVDEADGSGTVRVYGAMRELTDRRATEEALRKSESQ